MKFDFFNVAVDLPKLKPAPGAAPSDVPGFEVPGYAEVLAPTNRAVAVLRSKGVDGAKTVHSAIYKAALQQPRTRLLIEWLRAADSILPQLVIPSDLAHLKREQLIEARSAFREAMAAAATVDPDAAAQAALGSAMRVVGLDPFELLDKSVGNGGWRVSQEAASPVRLLDEACMLTLRTARDVAKGVRAILFVGDPRQLDPVITEEDQRRVRAMPAAEQAVARDQITPYSAVIQSLPTVCKLVDPMRQTDPAGQGILDVANWIGRVIDNGGALQLDQVWQTMLRTDGFEVVDAWPGQLLREAPGLCWRNVTRLTTIVKWRRAMGMPTGYLEAGEPVVLDFIRGKQEAERRFGAVGLVRNSNWWMTCSSREMTWSLRDNLGAQVSGVDGAVSENEQRVAEFCNANPDLVEDPHARFRFGHGRALLFQHGAATTVHRAQGGEWPAVALSAADLTAYARSSFRHSSGSPSWMSWLYTAITRARTRVYLVVGPNPDVDPGFIDAAPSGPTKAEQLLGAGA